MAKMLCSFSEYPQPFLQRFVQRVRIRKKWGGAGATIPAFGNAACARFIGDGACPAGMRQRTTNLKVAGPLATDVQDVWNNDASSKGAIALAQALREA